MATKKLNEFDNWETLTQEPGEYKIRVIAKDGPDYGDSDPSGPCLIRRLEAPSDLKVVPKSGNLSWTAPKDNGISDPSFKTKHYNVKANEEVFSSAGTSTLVGEKTNASTPTIFRVQSTNYGKTGTADDSSLPSAFNGYIKIQQHSLPSTAGTTDTFNGSAKLSFNGPTTKQDDPNAGFQFNIYAKKKSQSGRSLIKTIPSKSDPYYEAPIEAFNGEIYIQTQAIKDSAVGGELSNVIFITNPDTKDFVCTGGLAQSSLSNFNTQTTQITYQDVPNASAYAFKLDGEEFGRVNA